MSDKDLILLPKGMSPWRACVGLEGRMSNKDLILFLKGHMLASEGVYRPQMVYISPERCVLTSEGVSQPQRDKWYPLDLLLVFPNTALMLKQSLACGK